MTDSAPSQMPLGVTGLPQWNGWLFDEWLPELQGFRGRKVLREMQDNDPIIGAITFSLEMLIRQVEWTVQPGTEDDAGERAADLVDTALNDMAVTWPDTLSEILSFLAYGFSVHEVLYKRRTGSGSKHNDGLIGWHSWPIRGQETLMKWGFDDLGQPTAMIQRGPPDWKEHTIPLDKALHFRTSTRRNNPEGRSIYRNAYRPWYFKKHIEVIEGIGIERDLAGLPTMGVPPEYLAADASPANQAALEAYRQLVTNIRRDEQEGIIYPLAYNEQGHEMFKLSLLSTGGQRQFDTDAIIARYDQRILMTVMADFIMLGHEKVGSNALAQSKSKLFTAALGAWLSTIEAVINDQAIPRLLALNGMSTDNPPTIHHGDIERADLDSLGQFILNLSQAGVPLDLTPDGELTRHLMAQARLPEPPEPSADLVDDNAPEAPEDAPSSPDAALVSSAPKTASEPVDGVAAIRTVLDGLMDEVSASWE